MTNAGSEHNELMSALMELREAIGPILEDLAYGLRPSSAESLARWLAFTDLISSIIPLCRRHIIERSAQ